MNKLLTADEIADLLRVPKSWIYERTYRHAADPIPVIRVGRLLRFDEAAVCAWLDQRNTQHESGSTR